MKNFKIRLVLDVWAGSRDEVETLRDRMLGGGDAYVNGIPEGPDSLAWNIDLTTIDEVEDVRSDSPATGLA